MTASPTVLEENSSPEAVDEPLKAKARHSRSRGACARCKKRRQKCDEQRPACGRCQESGSKKCTYTIDLRCVTPRSSIRAIGQSGSPLPNRGPRLLNRLLKRTPVYKYEVEYEQIFKILKYFKPHKLLKSY